MVVNQVDVYGEDNQDDYQDAFESLYHTQGRPLMLYGRYTDLHITDNDFQDLSRFALAVYNANGELSLQPGAITVSLNEVNRCLGAPLLINSSFTDVIDNTVNEAGGSVWAYENIDGRLKNTEYMVAAGIIVHRANVTWDTTDTRQVRIFDNKLLDCRAQGILTEGNPYHRVSHVTIEENVIRTIPHAYSYVRIDEGDTTTVFAARKWPVIWISDTDSSQVLNNVGRCLYWTSSHHGQHLVGGAGLKVDGCDSVRIEGNHFDGMSQALLLRVDNRNSNNSSENRRTVIRHNQFTNIRRPEEAGIFQHSLQKEPVIHMGYKSKFTNLPAGVTLCAFQDNHVTDNVFHLHADSVDALFIAAVPATTLNHPLVWWPDQGMEDDAFFEGHTCTWDDCCPPVGDNLADEDANELEGNFINLEPYLEDSALSFSKIERYHHVGWTYDEEGDTNCVAQNGDWRHYRLDTQGEYQFPVDGIREGNLWATEFDLDTIVVDPELAPFVVATPRLTVPGTFPDLQAAVDWVAAYSQVPRTITVTETSLPPENNLGLEIPPGLEVTIQAQDSCVLDGEGSDSWFSLGAYSRLVWMGFDFRNASNSEYAIDGGPAELILEDCALRDADSLSFPGIEVTLQGDSHWEGLDRVAMSHDARINAPKGGLAWDRVNLYYTAGLYDTSHAAMLALGEASSNVIQSTLDTVSVRGSNGVGLELAKAPLTSRNCRFEDCDKSGLRVVLESTLIDEGSLVRNCDTGIEIVGSTVSASFSGTVIDSCLTDGLWMNYCDDLVLKQVEIRDCGGDGISAENADFRMLDCTVEDNAEHALNTGHTHADLGRFAGNLLSGGSASIFYFDGGEPVLDCGHNSLLGEGDCVLEGYSGADTLLMATYNWWGTTENLEDVICISPVEQDYQLYPICSADCRETTECISADDPGLLLSQADSLELARNYLDSRDTYMMIPEPYPVSPEAPSALHGVYRVSFKGGLDMEFAQEYFYYIAELFPGTQLAKLALDLAARCEAPKGNREGGAGDFLSLAEGAETTADSLSHVEKAVILQTEAELLGELNKGDGSDALLELPRFMTMAELLEWLRERDTRTADAEDRPFIPETFRLGHNYPNPFNLLTRFQVDLPVESQLRLAVYNLLGQRVTVLKHETMPAGRHELFWEGTNASGSVIG